MGPLVLEDVPGWVDQSTPLCDKIRAAAGGDYFPLQERVAQALSARLDCAGLDGRRAGLHHAERRPRPGLLAEARGDGGYGQCQVLRGSGPGRPRLRGPAPPRPQTGDRRQVADRALAQRGHGRQRPQGGDQRPVLIESMDVRATPAKPLLSEIEGIDVSNYQGRRSEKGPHVVLSAKDGTQVVWVKIGTWGRHMEATDEQKLARLFSFYKEAEGQPTLMGRVKYIDLRAPLREVTTPIDQYPATGR